MFRKTLFVAAFVGLVLALEGNFKLNNYPSGYQTNTVIKQADSYEPKADNYRIESVCQDQLNEQIRLELHASLNYMNMAAHFNSPNVAQYGLGKFYKKAAIEEQEHATQIIDYINKRGGQVKTLKVDLMDFIEEVFFNEQIQAIHQLKSWISKLKRMGDGVGEYLLDEEIGKSA